MNGAACKTVRQLVLLLAVGAMMPSAACANTQWFYERQAIPEGETVEVATSSSKFALTLKLPRQAPVKIPCNAGGVEAFWNTPENGRDETRSIAFSCSTASCGRAVVTPLLPWTSTLLESAPPLVDMWEGVKLDLACGGVDYGAFTGSLEAKVGDVDPVGKRGRKDDLDNTLTFRGGVNRPLLLGPNGAELWFTGFDRLGDSSSGVSDEAGV